jgi:hypothetical protein
MQCSGSGFKQDRANGGVAYGTEMAPVAVSV